eukprot:g3225.t1
MAMVDLNGEKTMVAAYTCTPLVTIPVDALEDGAHVVGNTVAELGYGNRPLEVLSLTAYNMERQPEQFVLVINREMSANLIKLEELATAPALTQPFAALGDTLGADGTHIPFAGILQADDQDAQFILTLRRNIDTGDVDLISSMKGVYFRLSDFVSEYTFPDYTYAENQAGTQMFHNMLKPLEGTVEWTARIAYTDGEIYNPATGKMDKIAYACGERDELGMIDIKTDEEGFWICDDHDVGMVEGYNQFGMKSNANCWAL